MDSDTEDPRYNDRTQIERTLVITTAFVPQDSVKKNLPL